MFSHVMVGSNDLERSKGFYDALFGKEAKRDEKGRLSYGRRGSVFMVSNPIDGKAASHANGGTVGFAFDSPEEVNAWHAAGIVRTPLLAELAPDLSQFFVAIQAVSPGSILSASSRA